MNLLRVRDMKVGEWYSLDAHDSKNRPVKLRFEILETYTQGIVSAHVRYLDGIEDTINGLVLGFSKKIEEPISHKIWKLFSKIFLLEVLFPKKKYSLQFQPSEVGSVSTLRADGYFHSLWYALYIFSKYALDKGHYTLFIENSVHSTFDV